MRAVADTGPIHYLVLIRQPHILPALFSEVAIPEEVQQELAHPRSPSAVQSWIAAPPSWLPIFTATRDLPAEEGSALDLGERAALALALERQPDLILMDDRAGVAAARAHRLSVTGTLGILVRAARRGILDLPVAVSALSRTNFAGHLPCERVSSRGACHPKG